MNRRHFLSGMLAAGAAPFVVTADGQLILTDDGPLVGTLYGFGAPKVASFVHDIVQLGEQAGDGPTQLRANRSIDFKWPTNSDTPVAPYGSWIDANGVTRGPAAFASATISSGTLPQAVTWDITTLMQKLMLENTGVYITPETAGIGAAAAFASKEYADPSQRPAFHIITSAGAFDVGALADSQIVTSSATQGMEPFMRDPYAIKPDLTGVSGAVTSATMTLYDIGGSQLIPCRYDAYYLDMPALVGDPVRQLGGQLLGIANSVAQDSDLARHPSVIFYPSFANQAAVEAAGWTNVDFSNYKPDISTGGGFVSWSDYSLTALRMTSRYTGHTFPNGDGSTILSWRRYLGNYTELYVRYLLKLDPDIFDGMNEGGVKLPGFESIIDSHEMFSYRMEHEKQSPANHGAYSLWIHAYDADNRVDAGTFAQNRPCSNVCLVEGRIYCIEQRVKLNTKTGSTFNADGVVQIWVNGVLVANDTTRRIRTSDVIDHIDNFFANFFHGGGGTPTAPIHYEFGGVCIATEYIGPPKTVVPTLPYAIPVQGFFKNISVNNLVDVEACPTHNCPYYETRGVGSVFDLWAGGAYDPDYSANGALLVHGGGHNGYAGNEVYAFNLSTALWERCRNPSLYAESAIDANGQYPDGQPFPPHTYDGVEVARASWYGGTKGRFVRFGFAGASVTQWMDAIDLSNTPNASWTRFGPAPLLFQSNLATYNMVVRDETRQGFWACTSGVGLPTYFVDKNGNLTSYNVWNGWIGRGGIAYSPFLDLLMVKSAVNFAGLYVMRANDPAAGWFEVNWSGTGPGGLTFGSPVTASGYGDWEQCGLTWSTVLGKFVSYVGRGQTTVYFLTPPADVINGTWVWTSETLVGESGTVPSANPSANGHWGGRFREVPSLKCFVWADSASQPVQLWRPTGMV